MLLSSVCFQHPEPRQRSRSPLLTHTEADLSKILLISRRTTGLSFGLGLRAVSHHLNDLKRSFGRLSSDL